MARNIVCMSGMRVTSEPITHTLEKITGTQNASISLAGDFLSNLVASGLSVPLGQLYNYMAVTPETWDKSWGERATLSKNFFSETYFVTTEGGGRRLSTVLLRDVGLRSIYIACGFTFFVNFERFCVTYWPA